ncbi:MAG: hypothetical protein OEU32_05685 [Acidimicrobiia bacterium]|nr:hypothetical protein [Acidimicrobiia bacterium]
MRRRALAVVVAFGALAAACGSDTDATSVSETPSSLTVEAESGSTPLDEPTTNPRPTPTTEAADNPYPPGTEPELAALVDPLVAELGLRFTYGSLINRSDGSYEASATGDHLAIYVEPIGDYSDAEFIENTWKLAAILTPYVFDTYGGVESYDVCQEPHPDVDDSAIPPPVTQLDITRADAAAIDWADGDLSDLLRVVFADEDDSIALRLEPRLQQLPAFANALADAR